MEELQVVQVLAYGFMTIFDGIKLWLFTEVWLYLKKWIKACVKGIDLTLGRENIYKLLQCIIKKKVVILNWMIPDFEINT